MTTEIRRQVSRFLVGGLIAVSLDWGTYYLLNTFFIINPSLSKTIGFLVGTIFAFYYNGVFSFQSDLGKVQLIRHLILYFFSMNINLIVFTLSMRFAPAFFGSDSLLSLGIATSFSMSINFVGMRNWVFRRVDLSK
jgi:putative flippase GtrA